MLNLVSRLVLTGKMGILTIALAATVIGMAIVGFSAVADAIKFATNHIGGGIGM